MSACAGLPRVAAAPVSLKCHHYLKSHPHVITILLCRDGHRVRLVEACQEAVHLQLLQMREAVLKYDFLR